MLEVQQYLRSGGTLKKLEDLGIKSTLSDDGQLVILNYSMIDSPKRHHFVQECRGLTLAIGTWDVAARSFQRFFNQGECPDLESKFDWSNFTAESKEDGSLILLYQWNGEWRINTRGSFAQGEISPGVGKSWDQVFRSTLVDGLGFESLIPGHTYVFELCSPFNKIVRRYQHASAYLLTAFHNLSGREISEVTLDVTAAKLKALRPTRYDLRTLDDVQSFLERQEDPTFEGLVLRDRKGMRLKVKSSAYVALHRLHGNGNIFHAKNIIPIVLKGEADETLTYFPEIAGPYFDYAEKLAGAKERMLLVWEAAKRKTSQKDFAQFVVKYTPLHSILFEARKRGVEPTQVWGESENLLVKRFSGG